MSYPIDLLCLKKGGDFAELWHAGILSRKQFTAKLKKKNVDAIDVAEASQKVIDRLVQTDTSHHRLSLVQSSTMLLGASRILNYQVDSALSEAEKLLRDWEPKMPVEKKKKKKKKRPDSPGDSVFREPKDPGTPDYSKNRVANLDDITINEDHIIPPVPIEAQPDYFGAFTGDLLDEILRTDYRLFGTEDLEVDGGSDSHPFRVPMAPEPEPTVEEPSEPVIEREGMNRSVPGTPKRKPTSPMVHDTPKRPRIPEDQELEAEPIPPQVELQVELPTLDMSSLASLRTSEILAPRPRRRKYVPKVDEHTKLSSETLRRRLANNYIGTIRRMRVDFRSRPDLFVTPCTQVARGRAWNADLLLNYNLMTIEPIFREETPVPPESPPREPQPRQDTTEVTDIQGMSRILPPGSVSVPPESTGPSQVVTDDNPPLDMPPVVEENPNGEPVSRHEPTLPDIVVPSPERRNRPKIARRIIDDFEETGAGIATPSSSDRTDRPNENGSHDGIWQQMLMEDILANLESLWLEKPVVDFEDLCPVDETTKEEAAQIFSILLTLYSEMKIDMNQEELWGRIIITKYSDSTFRCRFCRPNSDIDSD